MYVNQHFQKIVSAMWCEMKEERAVRRLLNSGKGVFTGRMGEIQVI